MPDTSPKLEFHPLSPDRWGDFEALFSTSRTCAGCWCMWFRAPRAQFMAQGGEGNRLAMKSIVESGEVPGILAYADGAPVGWCSVAPREQFGVIVRSRKLKPVDDRPAWAIVCFFVAKHMRGKGVASALIRAAVDYAAAHGAEIVEAYPTDSQRPNTPASLLYVGTVSAFAKAGFKEVARPSETRAIMRYVIGK